MDGRWCAGVDRRAGRRGGLPLAREDVSRIEGFSDAVFAFAVALAVSLEVPKTFDESCRDHAGLLRSRSASRCSSPCGTTTTRSSDATA